MKYSEKRRINWPIFTFVLFSIGFSQNINYEVIENNVYDRNIFIQGGVAGDIIGENPDHNFYIPWDAKVEAHFLKLATIQGRYWSGLADSLSGSFTGYEGGAAFHIIDKSVDDVEEVLIDHVGDKIIYIDVPLKKRKILAIRGGIYSLAVGNYYAGEFDGDSLQIPAIADPVNSTNLAEGLDYNLNGFYVGIFRKTFMTARVSTDYDDYIHTVSRQTNEFYADFLIGGTNTLEGSWTVDKEGVYGAVTTYNYTLTQSRSEKYYSWKSTGWRVGFEINRYQAFGRFVGLSYFFEIGKRPGLAKDALYATLGVNMGFAI